jgi:hypothetical protein
MLIFRDVSLGSEAKPRGKEKINFPRTLNIPVRVSASALFFFFADVVFAHVITPSPS